MVDRAQLAILSEHIEKHRWAGRATFTTAAIEALVGRCRVADARESELLEANNRYQQEARAARAAMRGDFQGRTGFWMLACFGEAISGDIVERNHRFLEEALELVQSTGCTVSEAHQLVDYVFSRPTGEPVQETGGVMVTLAALCLAAGLDMHQAAETELTRCWSKIDKIRVKQAAKPKHGPLPEAAPTAEGDRAIGAAVRVDYDGFAGTVQGHYVTREGRRGAVVQQHGTKVVHVYGVDRLKPDHRDEAEATRND